MLVKKITPFKEMAFVVAITRLATPNRIAVRSNIPPITNATSIVISSFYFMGEIRSRGPK
jgi:hypothetical protein